MASARDGRQHAQVAGAASPAELRVARGERVVREAAAGDSDTVPAASAVSRGGFLAALGSSAVLAAAAALAAPKEASANGMLDFPPARLNNRYFLMRSGEGGADREGRVQSHPIDKLHMDNRLTEQGVEEVRLGVSVCVCVCVCLLPVLDVCMLWPLQALWCCALPQ